METRLLLLLLLLPNNKTVSPPLKLLHSKGSPIYKQKRDPLECNNFRGIKLLSHTLKLWERVVESRLRKMVNISEIQYGFQPGKSTIQPLFCLRMLQEKHRQFGKELHMVFVDLDRDD